MKIGILGAGGIAGVLARTMSQMEEVQRYAIASRTLEKAQDFAAKYGFEKAYGSYEELVCDPGVELVYVATPHSHHYEDMKLCILHGKPVLCEKAFTMNSAQAKEIIDLAAEKKVFVAEAIWPRYMPSRKLIQDALDSGIIGRVGVVTGNLSYMISQVERIWNPALAGGALLDIGVYGLNFVLMHFGTEIERVESSVRMTDTGVDGMESITIFYKDGRMAVLNHSIYVRSDRKGIFYGDKGYMVVENINNPQSIAVYDLDDRLVKKIEVSAQISGYEYEIRECIRAIEEGGLEAPSMPLKDTLFVMETMDGLRKQWGMVYPQEVKTVR